MVSHKCDAIARHNLTQHPSLWIDLLHLSNLQKEAMGLGNHSFLTKKWSQ
jgi:hypothetical protein